MGNSLSNMCGWAANDKDKKRGEAWLLRVIAAGAIFLAIYVIFVKGGRQGQISVQTGGAPASEDFDAILKDTDSLLESLAKAGKGRSVTPVRDISLPGMSPDVPDASTW